MDFEINKAKGGAPVYPLTHTLEHLIKVYLSTLSGTPTSRTKEELSLTADTPVGILREALKVFEEDDEGLLEQISKITKHSSKKLEDKIYILPGKGHDGKGFLNLHFGDMVEAYYEGEWHPGTVFDNKYNDDGTITLMSARGGTDIHVDAHLIRKPGRG